MTKKNRSKAAKELSKSAKAHVEKRKAKARSRGGDGELQGLNSAQVAQLMDRRNLVRRYA